MFGGCFCAEDAWKGVYVVVGGGVGLLCTEGARSAEGAGKGPCGLVGFWIMVGNMAGKNAALHLNLGGRRCCGGRFAALQDSGFLPCPVLSCRT